MPVTDGSISAKFIEVIPTVAGQTDVQAALTTVAATGTAALPAAGGAVTGDITFNTKDHAPVLVDQSDGHTYRIKVTAGVLGVTLVT